VNFMAVLQAAALNIDSSVAINLVGWAFSLGLTFGFVRERLNSLDKRVERIEEWIDSQ
jgi:hypothetical protein